VKDLLDTAGVRTTAGSALFKDRVPQQDAEVVRRLKAAGAVLLGTQHARVRLWRQFGVQLFRRGSQSLEPRLQPRRLVRRIRRSGRGPAVLRRDRVRYGWFNPRAGQLLRHRGLKPTYGRVSTAGAIPLSWSLDHLGPMTRTVTDAALLLQVIAGYDAQDPGSIDLPVPDYLAGIGASASSLRLGIPTDYFYENLHPDIQLACTMRWGFSRN